MTRFLALSLVTLLAACGIKGDPEPVTSAPSTGITITGTAEAGVTARW